MRTELLRFNGAVERDPTVDAWMKEHAGELGAIAHQWFEVMRKCGDEVRELLHDGCPVVCLGRSSYDRVRIPKDGDQRSELMSITLPKWVRVLAGVKDPPSDSRKNLRIVRNGISQIAEIRNKNNWLPR